MQSFVVQSDEIEDVLSVEFYSPLFLENRKKIRSSKFQLVKLQDITTKITKGETPLWKGDRYQEQGVLFIKSENVLENELNLSSKTFIDLVVHERMNRSQLKKGDVLLNIVGASIGRSCVYDIDKEANINQAVCLIRPNNDVNPQWLSLVLNSKPFQTFLNQTKSGGARDNIDLYQVRELQIPLAPLEIQNQIVDIMQSAYSQKKQKEAEAQRLLDAIDGYVLDELGIKLLEVEDKMCFVVNSEEVRENRADAYYYQPRFIKLIEAVRRSSFEIKTLEDISTKIINGLDFRKFSEVGIPYLRVSNIKPNSFDISDIKFIPAFSISKDIELDSGDLLITRKGTYGISVIVDDEHKSMVISSEIFRVILKKDNVNPHYIAIWLNSNVAKQLFNRISTGGIMGHISQDALKNIQIILPPLKIQNKIADEVKRRMSEAERLKAEASKIIEEAKKKVEEMILAG